MLPPGHCSGEAGLLPLLPGRRQGCKAMWKFSTNNHLAVFGIRPELVGARAGLFHKIGMKYLVGGCFSSCLLASAPKACGEGQIRSCPLYLLVSQAHSFLCLQTLRSQPREKLCAGCEISAWIKWQRQILGFGKSTLDLCLCGVTLSLGRKCWLSR